MELQVKESAREEFLSHTPKEQFEAICKSGKPYCFLQSLGLLDKNYTSYQDSLMQAVKAAPLVVGTTMYPGQQEALEAAKYRYLSRMLCDTASWILQDFEEERYDKWFEQTKVGKLVDRRLCSLKSGTIAEIDYLAQKQLAPVFYKEQEMLYPTPFLQAPDGTLYSYMDLLPELAKLPENTVTFTIVFADSSESEVLNFAWTLDRQKIAMLQDAVTKNDDLYWEHREQLMTPQEQEEYKETNHKSITR